MNRFLKKDHIWGALLIISFLSILLATSSTGCIPQILNARRSAWESRAKATLRAYGSTQLAFQNTTEDYHYGTWEELKEAEYIADGYSKKNIIDNYILWTSVDDAPYYDSNTDTHYHATFTVVAFPRDNRPGYLSTFAIREDQVVREYDPSTPNVSAWGSADDFGAKSWEPIS